MSEAPDQTSMSQSLERALRWAEASSALRGPGRPVDETDLFLGTLLAHPDTDGEMRRLIGHFGLSARDLLPDNFPLVTVDSLGQAAATVAGVARSRDSSVENVLAIAASMTSGGPTQLAHLVGAQLAASESFKVMFQRGINRYGVSVTRLADEYRTFLAGLDLQTDGAGRRLGDWLAQQFPRNPASLAAVSADTIDPNSDFVGIGVEADAFAYLLASKDLVPPVAVGLFGNWGSGKSFLMAKIRRRIEQLTDVATKSESDTVRVWTNIAHIEFNAWEYVETNLWAALLNRIFEQLTPSARLKLSERRRAKTDAEITAQKKVVETARKELEPLKEAETEKATAARKATTDLDQTAEQAAAIRDGLITRELEAGARSAFIRQVSVAIEDSLGEDLTEAITEANAAAVAARSGPWLNTKFWTRWRLLYLGAVVLVPVLGFLLEQYVSALTGAVSSLVAVLTLAAFGLRSAAAFSQTQQEALRAAEDNVDTKLRETVQAARDRRTKAEDELKQARKKLEEKAEELRAAEAEQTVLEQKGVAQTAGSILAGFVSSRNVSQDYRSQLSLISTVKRDLTDLADLTREYNEEHAADPGRSPNRIVLYIDDLDRCPPKKVVEVLEAVHLLLAFRLFVVVVAVDTRWLTSALHTGLPTLQRQPDETGGQPSAVDYLEKIFQVPFWVDPLDDAARQRLLRGLLLPSVARFGAEQPGQGTSLVEVGPREKELVAAMLTDYGVGLDSDARALSITSDELAFIESLAPLIGGTPRRVKRFVNTCQLLLAMAPPLSTDGEQPTERMATCFMAALHDAMPRLAERLAAMQPTPPGTLTLSAAVARVSQDTDLERLNQWFAERNEVQKPPSTFGNADLSLFLKRFNVIRRLRFEPTPLPAGS
ncbi:P-loop NTPase fold protein [Rhodococcus wratislaviensis]|uniref:KAP NTPase domain-containing protein n=1 Tax=Rhodococcus wratislaviensis NBRC 100605 TaxID=1219028 RepID=X0PXM7_RHOWR|nr:P-loop NTPase fold protein [Rhodococcus wratislaviensis]GAF48259.1 hypothetical protein RW1_051_00230 [Rhodococcus wratislaviensis NBRC 100605]